MADLFSHLRETHIWHGKGVLHLPGFAASNDLLPTLEAITETNPFRHMKTPGGREMPAAMTNCGQVGWISDAKGYRYSETDPQTGAQWPDMPPEFLKLAQAAAAEFGAPDYRPDACLVNRYAPGARMALHQDRDEADFRHPVVSISMGASAQFMLGGQNRTDPVEIIQLEDGDALVFGRDSRLAFHGIKPLKRGDHPALEPDRICMTFRCAL